MTSRCLYCGSAHTEKVSCALAQNNGNPEIPDNELSIDDLIRMKEGTYYGNLLIEDALDELISHKHASVAHRKEVAHLMSKLDEAIATVSALESLL